MGPVGPHTHERPYRTISNRRLSRPWAFGKDESPWIYAPEAQLPTEQGCRVSVVAVRVWESRQAEEVMKDGCCSRLQQST